MLGALLAALLPQVALAGSPFATGTAAAIAVMVSGVLGWFGKISWWWLVGVVIGIVLVFGAPQIVTWVRTMFGV